MRIEIPQFIWIAWFVIVSIATILATIRAIIGPTNSDRAVGLDTWTTITTGFWVILALYFFQYILLSVSMVYAILSFLGVLAIARYLERGL
ncbi:monovalent cation/H+ antiporter complex subunit F [Athalassotoga saccharophila]|uniref:monovalent cation/H+ antiporter complex subunit F n=1 Tax=Athalassotoga saccharophila TaxID=1441386 RepID=UPI00137B007D|nr:monovalent cation/H+ antiporter complex subunit F [Athalassotoga saccharophila]BBJ28697.1 Na(+)/H(+) antiporter subunit F [Athalassotoga saccharophila]